MGCHFLLQETFPTQGSNQYLLYCQGDSLPLSHLENTVGLERCSFLFPWNIVKVQVRPDSRDPQEEDALTILKESFIKVRTSRVSWMGVGSPLDGWRPYGLPRWLSGKESVGQLRRHELNLWVGKIPWRGKWQTIPESLPGKSDGQRSLAGYSPRGSPRVGHNLGLNKKPIEGTMDKIIPAEGQVPNHTGVFPVSEYEVVAVDFLPMTGRLLFTFCRVGNFASALFPLPPAISPPADPRPVGPVPAWGRDQIKDSHIIGAHSELARSPHLLHLSVSRSDGLFQKAGEEATYLQTVS